MRCFEMSNIVRLVRDCKSNLLHAAEVIEQPYNVCWNSRRISLPGKLSIPGLPSLAERGTISRKKFTACLIASPISKSLAIFLRLIAKVLFPFLSVNPENYINPAFTKSENQRISNAFRSREFEVVLCRRNIHCLPDVKNWRYVIMKDLNKDPRIANARSLNFGLQIRLKGYQQKVITKVKVIQR